MERNYSIDFLKILFALSIACGHFKGSVLSSDLIVELFLFSPAFFSSIVFTAVNITAMHFLTPPAA